MTLLEKQQQHDFVLVDLMKNEQKSEEHLKRHPFGVIPVLKDGDFELYESRAIIRYLDHKFTNNPLTPKDLESFGRMEQWMGIEQAYFSEQALKIIKQCYFGKMRGQTPDMSIVAEAKPKVEHVLDVANAALSKHPYFAGDSFSLAEITWMPYVEYLFSAEMGDLINKRSHVKKWWENISKRPTWQKVRG
jgi:glutathione S-transferase